MFATLRSVSTPDAPFRLADMTPRRRPFGLIWLLLAAVLAGGGVAAYFALRNEAPAVSAEPAAATSSAVTLSERAACVKLDPLLLRASQMYAAFVKDQTKPSSEEASALRADLREVQKVAPAAMSADIGQVMKGVVLLPRGGDGINFEDWQSAGINLHRKCLGATSSTGT